MLHIAPEPWLTGKLAAMDEVSYVSGDLESPRAMLKLDVTDLDLEPDSFDLILCSHVLEHVPEDRKALAEFHRVLTPGGTAVLMHPIEYELASTHEDPEITSPGDRERHFLQHDHVRLYGRDFASRPKQVGFTVTVVRYRDTLGRETRRRCCLDPDRLPGRSKSFRGDDIYLCRKPLTRSTADTA